jgi:hypothetical protein
MSKPADAIDLLGELMRTIGNRLEYIEQNLVLLRQAGQAMLDAIRDLSKHLENLTEKLEGKQ